MSEPVHIVLDDDKGWDRKEERKRREYSTKYSSEVWNENGKKRLILTKGRVGHRRRRRSERIECGNWFEV